ncbi:ABC transporter ATP-binding protein/permease [Nocardia brevicatena]|uniref:ABC transporter ATP-binding protein/permease n=1 Tax=Nocardia brevicatena TaxID=37327 RepID=UPI0002EB7597|nr:ATP-binding cassette domain-containing protein [Nocardia brevicatena]
MRRGARLRTGWLLVLISVLLVVVLGPVFAPYAPTAPSGPPFRPPSPDHPLGTDVVGRDVLSRVLHGGLPLLVITGLSLAVAYLAGMGLGLLAGLRRGADRWIMRPVDTIVVIPWFLLLAVIATALGAGPGAIVLTASLTSVPWIARIVRTAVHEIAGAGFVESARARGEPLWRLALVEVLPNLRAVVQADAGVRLSGVISIVAVGGFLGLGLRPPSPDWALMITENRPGFGLQPWAVLAPALLITALVVSVNMVADRTLVPRRAGIGGTAPTLGADAGGVRVEHLTVRTAESHPVLEDVSVRVAPGRSLAILGPSGAGKTTFVSAVLGALPAGLIARGTVTIGATGSRRAVGFVPQDPATGLNPALRIGTAIAEIARLRGGPDVTAQVTAALRRVGLPDDRSFRRRFPHELSGGQQQRVLLAMALLGDPAVVVLDEPTTGLDARAREELVDTLSALRRESATTLLIITHDLTTVAPLIDEVLELAEGRVVSYAPLRTSTTKTAPAPPTRSAVSATEPILRVDELAVAHRSRPVVDGISFTLRPGVCLALTGRSGAGKTTVARALAGLHPPARGTIRLDGAPLHPTVDRRAVDQRRAVQLIFQNPAGSLNPAHRIGTQIGRPLRLLRGMDEATAARETERLLTAVRLDPTLAARRPGELSGGQQQRVAIARALAAGPRVLICDEITASLDTESQRIVLELLDRLRRTGVALLLISHQSTVIERLADSVLALDELDRTARPLPLAGADPGIPAQ